MFASRWQDEGTLVDVDSINSSGARATWSSGELLVHGGRVRPDLLADLRRATGQIRLLGRVDAFEGGPARLAVGRPTIPASQRRRRRPARCSRSPAAAACACSRSARRRAFPRGFIALPELERVRRRPSTPPPLPVHLGDGEGLRIFRVDPDGTLLETAREMQGGGEIVLTAPPS